MSFASRITTVAQLFNNTYRFERELGKGGFGRVFLAREDVSNHLVAIKQLNNREPDQQNAIVHEIRTVSRLNHPNIVTYHHQFSESGLLFLVMEFCPGGSLRSILANGKIHAHDALKWTQTAAEALRFVHEKSIIHHDIKPDNLLVTKAGMLKISDFGIANTGGGTPSYMSPETLAWNRANVLDPRVDVYALGVTLMELLTGRNPFFHKTVDEILALHERGEFPIQTLPDWQQEVILKAINKVPELRFQSMHDFAEAIAAKRVPVILDTDAIRAGQAAERAERSLATKKWFQAGSLLEFVAQKYPSNVKVLRALGRFQLMQQKIAEAKTTFEKAIALNPRIDVQKDLGWINLGLGNYPAAISLLSDHLHRHPSDLEAHNLLLQCFYETDRHEVATDLAGTLLQIDSDNPCFANNFYVASLLLNLGTKLRPGKLFSGYTNEFLDYNYAVVAETALTHAWASTPTLKSKLLFMDYRFRKFEPTPLYISDGRGDPSKPRQINRSIITFGRTGFGVNDVHVAGSLPVSRRHCVVVCCLKNVWLYDLNSTGTYVNGQRVKGKLLLVGRNSVRIGSEEFVITTEKDSLI